MAIDSEAKALYRVIKTIREMAHDRGYYVPQEELDLREKDFLEKYGTVVDRNRLTYIVTKAVNSSDQLVFFFPDDPSLGVKPIRKYIERMVEQNIKRGIIVVKEALTSSAIKALSEHPIPNLVLEYFRQAELMVNITAHSLVPKHVVISEEEKQQILKRYRVEQTQLQRMQPDDPVAKYFGLARTQVVKIIRKSETAGRYVTYRIVL